MSRYKIGVVVFPGSNCDRDAGESLKAVYGAAVDYLWHKSAFDESAYDLVILPGGFSYGDYLRCGAMARFSPAMDSVVAHARRGGYLMGICNGFQILCEARLLPGSLVRNKNLKHIARDVSVRAVNRSSVFTKNAPEDWLIMPVSHSEGAWYADENTLAELKGRDRVAFEYATDINGSLERIAGILSPDGKILGMMPHPERALDREGFVSTDGRVVFDTFFGTTSLVS